MLVRMNASFPFLARNAIRHLDTRRRGRTLRTCLETCAGALGIAPAIRIRAPRPHRAAGQSKLDADEVASEAGPAEAGPARRSGRCGEARFPLRIGAEWAATVDDRDAFLLRLDDAALQHAVAGEGHEIAWLQRKHLLVAPESGARAQPLVEAECDLRDLA